MICLSCARLDSTDLAPEEATSVCFDAHPKVRIWTPDIPGGIRCPTLSSTAVQLSRIAPHQAGNECRTVRGGTDHGGTGPPVKFFLPVGCPEGAQEGLRPRKRSKSVSRAARNAENFSWFPALSAARFWWARLASSTRWITLSD